MAQTFKNSLDNSNDRSVPPGDFANFLRKILDKFLSIWPGAMRTPCSLHHPHHCTVGWGFYLRDPPSTLPSNWSHGMTRECTFTENFMAFPIFFVIDAAGGANSEFLICNFTLDFVQTGDAFLEFLFGNFTLDFGEASHVIFATFFGHQKEKAGVLQIFCQNDFSTNNHVADFFHIF